MDKPCAACATEVGPLEVFPNANGPGILCLACYADSPAGRYIPTAAELRRIWGGK